MTPFVLRSTTNDSYKYNDITQSTDNITRVHIKGPEVTLMNNNGIGSYDSITLISLVCFYVFVFVAGFVPNTFLIYLIFTNKFMRIRLIFTASISVSHILICVSVIPLVIVYHSTNSDTLVTPCDVIVCFCVGVTSYSMLATAIRRCLALSERFRSANFTYRGKVKNILFIWIFSLAVSVPYMFNGAETRIMFDILQTPKQILLNNVNISGNYRRNTYLVQTSGILPINISNTATSQSSLSNNLDNTSISPLGNIDTTITVTPAIDMPITNIWIYSVVLFCFQILIPCISALTLQIITYRRIRRRPNQVHWTKEIAITKQHIYMIIIFCICWAPLMTINLLFKHSNIPSWVSGILQPLAVSCVVYFPIVYYFLNAHIKREFTQWIRRLIQQYIEQQL